MTGPGRRGPRLMLELPFHRLEAAAAELGVEATDLIDHALSGHLELALFADGVEYRELEADFIDTNGRVERLLVPPHFVPPGRSPLIPPGLYRLPAIAAHHAATRGSGFVDELQDLEGDEIYFLAEAYEIRIADVVIEDDEWGRFRKSWSPRPRREALSSARGEEKDHLVENGQGHEAAAPAPAQTWISTRAAARVVRTRNERLYALADEGIRAGVARSTGSAWGERRHVRWRKELLQGWWTGLAETVPPRTG